MFENGVGWMKFGGGGKRERERNKRENVRIYREMKER